MPYKVKLNIFEGPLDLLLFLIKREKIDIYDIPISKVTDQYLEYLELMKLLDLEIAGEFLVVAATLMHIKSKMLLPREEADREEEEEDPREELVRRLLEYKKYKDAAAGLESMREERRKMFLRKGAGGGEKTSPAEGEEYFEASLFDLIAAFRKALKEVPRETFHEVIKSRFSVSDKIHKIYHMLAKQPKLRFSSLFESSSTKEEVIVVFLAILELMKMREIFAVQKGFFGEIEIVRNPELVKEGS